MRQGRAAQLLLAGSIIRLSVSESDQFVAALKKQGMPVWYLKARDEGHGFQKKSNADFQFYGTVEFLEEYLLE